MYEVALIAANVVGIAGIAALVRVDNRRNRTPNPERDEQ